MKRFLCLIAFVAACVLIVRDVLGAPVFTDANWAVFAGFPGADGSVGASAADHSGNVYVAGTFTIIGGLITTNIAKWNGATWTPLGPWTGSGTIGCLAMDNSGNLYAGGYFTLDVPSGPLAQFVAKWNGNNWSSLGSPGALPGPVTALTCDSVGNLYAGSDSYVMKWNGTKWSVLGPMNGGVQALAVDTFGNLFVGGSFLSVGSVTAKYVAEWSGGVWNPLGSGVNGAVYALAFDSAGNLFVGGNFTTAGATNATNMARWNGAGWFPVGPGLNSSVRAVVFDTNGNLYAGGLSGVTKWTGSNWVEVNTPRNDPTEINTLSVDSAGHLYAGGSFTFGDAISADGFVEWNGAAWIPPGGGLSASAVALASDRKGDVYVTGNFSEADGLLAEQFATWTGTAWATNVPPPNGLVSSMTCDSLGNLYAGIAAGYYGVSPGVVEWNGAAWANLGTASDSVVTVGFDPSGNLCAAGKFTNMNGLTAGAIAEWNGVNWTNLGTGITGAVNTLTCDGRGKVYAAGTFSEAGGGAANSIAQWNGTYWSALGSGITGTISALAVDLSGNVYAGGLFATPVAGGGDATNIAEWTGTNWIALGDGVDNQINTAACDAFGNLYVAGTFLHAGGSNANHIAMWNGTNWTALGSGMPAGYGGPNYSPGTVSDMVFDVFGNLYVCGNFNLAGANCSYFIAKASLSRGSYNLQLTQPAPGANIILATGTPGYEYALDLATNLTPPINWQPQTTNTVMGTTVTFTNSSTASEAIYRTRYVPR